MSARRRARPIGFTLVELLVVLAIAAAVLAAAGAAIARAAPGAAEQRAARQIVDALRFARLDALASASRVDAALWYEPDSRELRLVAGDRERRWPDAALTPLPPDPAPVPPLGVISWSPPSGDPAREPAEQGHAFAVRFGPAGLASEREWRFVGARTSDRIWRVVFDPVSGEPSARLDDEQASRG